jgi:addiction module HigA family antidote
MRTLISVHPGEILLEKFMKPADISACSLAKMSSLPMARISGIIAGSRGVTANTALRLAACFGTTARFWLDLQDNFDAAGDRPAEREPVMTIRIISDH